MVLPSSAIVIAEPIPTGPLRHFGALRHVRAEMEQSHHVSALADRAYDEDTWTLAESKCGGRLRARLARAAGWGGAVERKLEGAAASEGDAEPFVVPYRHLRGQPHVGDLRHSGAGNPW